MALLKENINNLIIDDLDKRNQNWTTIEDSLELKADKTYVDNQDALKADKTYVDNKVKTDVPVGAKFTDTVYSHPASHPASMITGLPTSLPANGGNADTVGGFTVGVSVPANAKFTDTVVDISGKADKTYVDDSLELKADTTYVDNQDELKADITYVDSQDELKADKAEVEANLELKADKTEVNASLELKADKTYVDNKVKTDVPVGAKFTDTVYSHPASHPASMITGLPTSLPANGGNADTVGGFTVGVSVPANAKFTDTVVDISGKADKTYVDDSLELKADIAYVNELVLGGVGELDLSYKADKVYVDDSLALKTDKTYVDASLELKADTTYVDDSLELKADKTEVDASLELKADITYVDNKVQTDVPSGAEFTDTVTTINSKTGAISKDDIVALGIPSQDTVYTHPSNHPASMITESSTKRFVSDSEKSTWNSKSDTDTVTTINGKTGAISKADIVALGIPSQDTNTTYDEITTAEIDTGTASTLRTITGRRVKYILDKVQGLIGGLTKSDVGLSNVDNTSDASKPISTATQTALNAKANATDLTTHTDSTSNPHSVTKAQVGLSNVDNIKQMPISGGVLENYREKLVTLSGTSTTINLLLGNVFTHTLSGNTTYTISNAVSGQAHSFTLIITQTATVRTLTFPSSVKWQGGEIPDMSEINKTYILTFVTVDGGTNWLGMFGGEF